MFAITLRHIRHQLARLGGEECTFHSNERIKMYRQTMLDKRHKAATKKKKRKEEAPRNSMHNTKTAIT